MEKSLKKIKNIIETFNNYLFNGSIVCKNVIKQSVNNIENIIVYMWLMFNIYINNIKHFMLRIWIGSSPLFTINPIIKEEMAPEDTDSESEEISNSSNVHPQQQRQFRLADHIAPSYRIRTTHSDESMSNKLEISNNTVTAWKKSNQNWEEKNIPIKWFNEKKLIKLNTRCSSDSKVLQSAQEIHNATRSICNSSSNENYSQIDFKELAVKIKQHTYSAEEVEIVQTINTMKYIVQAQTKKIFTSVSNNFSGITDAECTIGLTVCILMGIFAVIKWCINDTHIIQAPLLKYTNIIYTSEKISQVQSLVKNNVILENMINDLYSYLNSLKIGDIATYYKIKEVGIKMIDGIFYVFAAGFTASMSKIKKIIDSIVKIKWKTQKK